MWTRWQRIGVRGVRDFVGGKRDPYDVLGVSKSATTKQIKDAFITLSKKYHPDRPTGSAARFLEVKDAYDMLKDEKKRADFDAYGSGGGGGMGRSSDGFGSSPPPPNWGPRPESDFSRGTYRREWRYEGNFNPKDAEELKKQFERIFRQFRQDYNNSQEFREQVDRAKQKMNRGFEEEARKRWSSFAGQQDKYTKENQWRVNWSIVNRIILLYFGLFLLVTIFQAMNGPIKVDNRETKQKPARDDRAYSYTDDEKERFQRMMRTPPMDRKADDPWGNPSSKE
ncbi:Molecular chaperone DnaJ [Aphelenchoides fujianensis]|nr:Molecular chaperone DnaJ [Aphelenchoides fujianensis]